MSVRSPQEVRERALRVWESGRFLSAWVAGESCLPLEVPLGLPSGGALLEAFAATRQDIQRLREGSAAQRGFGYRLVEEVVEHRQLGTQRIPRRAVIEAEEDFLQLVGKVQAFARFRAIVEETRSRLPELVSFLRAKPLIALEHGDRWSALLTVCSFFQAQVRPGCYLRQIDLPGVHTKFIEQHEGLLHELLPLVAPEGTWGARPSGAHAFERRFGLRYDPPLVRFRALDEGVAVGGLRDLSVPVQDFTPAPGLRRVLVVENKIPGLCLPEVAGTWAVFGMGNGVLALSEVPWLREVELWYWGDLDTEGFRILARFRDSFPHCRSLLMDEATLLRYRDSWGQEPSPRRREAPPAALTAEELSVYDGLEAGRWGDRVRLEQEAIRFGDVRRAIAKFD